MFIGENMEFKEKTLEEFIKSNDVENNVLVKCKENDDVIVIPDGITAIGNKAFTKNFKVKAIFVPSSVKKIYPGYREESVYECEPDDYIGAFSNCLSLVKIRLPKNITEIPDSTFANCSNLTDIEIPSKVTNIGKMAFYGCTNLENVILPDGLLQMQMYSFYNCSYIKNLIVPKSVNFIGKYAFSGMTEEQTVYLQCSEKDAENFHPAWRSGAECKFVFNFKK